jgi:UDP-galactopyranose mutase
VNAALDKRYEAEAEQLDNVTFVGRLATYKYYNMDQVVGQALAAFKKLRDREEAAASALIEGMASKSRGKVAQAA